MTRPFDYLLAGSEAEAIAAAALPGAMIVAGGTDLMQLWKTGVSAPDLVVDVSRLPFAGVRRCGEGVMIGALARLSDVAADPLVVARQPLVAEAILASASQQVRNMATVGGNLMQRTRCAYFRSADLPCEKRRPGSGCGARDGENRLSAILGATDCVAVHASDLAVALTTLEAVVRLRGPGGERSVPLEDVYAVDGPPQAETVLQPGELIVEVEVPAAPGPSTYVKVRDRASFEFAVVSVAASLRVVDGRVEAARLTAGGVAPRPWRLRACEAALVGGPATEAAFRVAAALSTEGARPLAHNGFKVDLLQRTVLAALLELGARP